MSAYVNPSLENTENTIGVSPECLSQDEFDQKHGFSEMALLSFNSISNQNSSWKRRTWRNFTSIFPFFCWIQSYRWKSDLFADCVAGCTVGVMQIPQGLTASILAGVPPIIGLYMAFFPVFIHIFMSTSRHINLGTFAVVCIMTKPIVAMYADEATVDKDFETPRGLTLTEAIFVPENSQVSSVQVAAAVALAVGICQLCLGLFRLGSTVSILLSDSMSSGFSTAAAFHLLTSQLSSLLGVPVGKHNGDFKLILVFRDIMFNLSAMNFVSFLLSGLTLAVLITYNEVIKPRLQKKFRYPFPIELLCMIAATLASAALNLGPEYGVKCLGHIPKGLPEPSLPPVWLLPKIILQSLPIALVGFTITFSMASILAKKGNYDIQANQEAAALGSANIFSSFFSCAPISASLSRSLVQQGVGGKTQIANLVACAMLLLVMLFIGPYFEPLPQCVLAAILVVTLKGMFLQVKDFPVILKNSKIEAVVWMGTFLVSILWDIDYGLGAGLLLSVLSVALYGQKLQVQSLGLVSDTSLYLDTKRYKAAKPLKGIEIIRILGNLHFANKITLESKIAKIFDVSKTCPTSIVIDMSGVGLMDTSAAELILSTSENQHSKGATLCLANCPVYVRQVLKKMQKNVVISKKMHLFASIGDAVAFLNSSDL